MSTEEAASQGCDLLRRLARHDEHSVQTVLAPAPTFTGGMKRAASDLDRRTRLLVHLAALLVVGASTESLRWAVELASTTGADDDALVAVLVAAASAAGSAEVVAAAPRLALAMGYEPVDRPH